MRRKIGQLEVFEDMETGVLEVQGYGDTRSILCVAKTCEELVKHADLVLK